MSTEPVPLLVPELSLPSYTFVPDGPHPHPISNPRGHSFGTAADRSTLVTPDNWDTCLPYLRGIDLFNHGYFWEAHEVWEGLWHAQGRKGPVADFLKALIKLAAAGVKARQGVGAGVRTHAQRSAVLFRQAVPSLGPFLGLATAELVADAAALVRKSYLSPTLTSCSAREFLGSQLNPHR